MNICIFGPTGLLSILAESIIDTLLIFIKPPILALKESATVLATSAACFGSFDVTLIANTCEFC